MGNTRNGTLGDDGAEPKPLRGNPPQRMPSDVLKIRILSVLLVLVLVVFAIYGLASEGVFDKPDDPYPSEDTPLTLQSWGVTWSRDFNESVNDVPVWAYADVWVSLTKYLDHGSMEWYSPFHCGEFIEIAAFTVPTTLDEAEDLPFLESTVHLDNGVEVHSMTAYFISDTSDPEVFNAGDTLSFIHIVFRDGSVSSVGFEENVVYEIGLGCTFGGGGTSEGYGIAVHDGQLYSWIDHGPVDDPLS